MTEISLSSVQIGNDCLTAFNQLKSRRGPAKPNFVIYKISDDYSSVVVEKSSSEKDWEEFLQIITSAVDSTGNPAPRYAAYDVEYDLGAEGKR